MNQKTPQEWLSGWRALARGLAGGVCGPLAELLRVDEEEEAELLCVDEEEEAELLLADEEEEAGLAALAPCS